MKRTFFCALALVALASTGLAAERFGLGQSRAEFTVVRDSSAVVQRANILTELHRGDRLVNNAQSLRIHGTNGSVLQMARDTDARIRETGAIDLVSGGIASSSLPESPQTLHYGDLSLHPEGDLERLLYVARVEEDATLTVQAVEGDLRVLDPEGEQIAFVAQGDTLTLGQDAGAWRSVAPGIGAPNLVRPAGIFRMQGQDESGVSGGEGDRRRGGWWLTTPTALGIAGGAALIGGGYLIYDNYIDDDDDDDDEEPRGPQSPIVPPMD